jgi:hypothetical protein
MDRRQALKRQVLGTICLFALSNQLVCPVFADNINFGAPEQAKPFNLQSIQLNQKPTMSTDLFPQTGYALAQPQPIPLQGVKIEGLNKDSVLLLGMNYFVVVDNTKFTDMADVYRENRLDGKTNFVTADCILHSYFAFTNRVIASAILETIGPKLYGLLGSMLDVCLEDYKTADDEDVRSDIEHNMAYLVVGLKLLNPNLNVPVPDSVMQMVTPELKLIYDQAQAQSNIFDRPVNYSLLEPTGWYNSSSKLQSFYRARAWVSTMGFPLNDTTFDIGTHHGNNFRRSVLLFRCLDKAMVKGRPATDVLQELYQAWNIFGTPMLSPNEKTLLPKDYQQVFSVVSSELKVTLTALAEPFYRTKLLLNIRNKQKTNIETKSIFDLDSNQVADSNNINFHLFPLVGEPETSWLSDICPFYPADEGLITWPIGLLLLHSRGAGQANNLLAANSWRLDPEIGKVLPYLDKATLLQINANAATKDRRWHLIQPYFTPYASGAQTALKTEMWFDRRLESAIAAYIDSHLAILPETPPQTKTGKQAHNNAGANSSAANAESTDGTGGDTTARKTVYYHYLDPNVELFSRIKSDANDLQAALSAIGYNDHKYADTFNDFLRLSDRLGKISELELEGKALPYADSQLLANIDYVLDQVTTPTAGTYHVYGLRTGVGATGMNLALGRPGLAYMVMQHGDKTTLARGGLYTFFEIPGDPIPDIHWQRQLDFSMLSLPSWTKAFDVVQQPVTRHKLSQ